MENFHTYLLKLFILNMMTIFLVMLFACADRSGRSYYLSIAGNDNDRGTYAHPWKNLEKAGTISLRPGDRIYLRGGDTIRGCLILEKQSGIAGKPILVSSYGKGRATLDAGSGTGLRILNCNNLVVSNLNIVGAGRKFNHNGNGVEVTRSSRITLRGISSSGFQNAGIWITGCDSITLERVVASFNGFTGIGTDHTETSGRIVVRYCRAVNNPGNPDIRDNHSGSGILLSSVKSGLVEYCEASWNGWDMPRLGNGPVGIWTWNSDSVVFRYCLAHHNKSPGMDGGGFDFDGAVTNSVMEYNFSHHNGGSGFMLCQFAGAPGELSGNQVRFNVSLDDGLGCHFAGIMIYVGGSGFGENMFYNNTIINTFHSALNIDGVPQFLKDPPQLYFYNNLFISGQDQIMNLSLLPGTVLLGNAYWAYGDGGFSTGLYKDFKAWVRDTPYEKSGTKTVGIYADPLIQTDFASLPEDPYDPVLFPAFYPLPGSPLKGNGLPFSGMKGVDFRGNDFRKVAVSAGDRFIGAFK